MSGVTEMAREVVAIGPHVVDYRPNQDVLQQMGAIELVTLTGPAGAGKDSLRSALPYPRVVCLTTREMRGSETDGVDYYFYRTAEQLSYLEEGLKTGQLVQAKLGPTGHIYGSFIDAYPQSGKATLDCVAAQAQEFRTYGFFDTINLYVTPPSFDELFNRLTARNPELPENLHKRFVEGVESLEVGLEDELFLFVVNDNLPTATQHATDIVEGHEIPSHRLRQARRVAATVLKDLQEYTAA